jgi:prolyl-tRNA editing enzyme YbaK/EbsC (Cys-tRNA(Pro) deacylase)
VKENTLDADQLTDAIRNHPAVARVREALADADIDGPITVMPAATHTAQQAADALGISVGEIAKSIIFKAQDARAGLVITSGANRVDRIKVIAAIGQDISKADADFVRDKTGFVIGGVAPVGHVTTPIVLMDRDLLRYASVWPAAGHPNTMFKIAPSDLVRITGSTVHDIAEEK